jgi:hypothetical protein
MREKRKLRTSNIILETSSCQFINVIFKTVTLNLALDQTAISANVEPY